MYIKMKTILLIPMSFNKNYIVFIKRITITNLNVHKE